MKKNKVPYKMKHLLIPLATCLIGFLLGFYLARKMRENTPSWLFMVRGKAVTIDSQKDDEFKCTFELTRNVAFTDRPFHKIKSITSMELHSILNQMIHKEKNPPNTTISLESNSEDTHSVVEIINVEKPDIKNPNKITLACKFLTEKIDLKKGYNNVDLTIDDLNSDFNILRKYIDKENVLSGVAAFGKRVKSYELWA